MSPGAVSVPEVIVAVLPDTVGLAVRGERATVAAAWQRLPRLFTPSILTEDTAPLIPDLWVWPTDLTQRTGRSAASLAWLTVCAPHARTRARDLLPRLDPAAGHTRAVFYTTDQSLVGLGFPVRTGGDGVFPRMQWADGRAGIPAGCPGSLPATRAAARPGPSPWVLHLGRHRLRRALHTRERAGGRGHGPAGRGPPRPARPDRPAQCRGPDAGARGARGRFRRAGDPRRTAADGLLPPPICSSADVG